ncbi:MAG: hypothetical protein L6R36_002572 [Xanthoria steineri]|nr:MAG: hypothetical protein L6R36_002572 [Xanthoria steineri]
MHYTMSPHHFLKTLPLFLLISPILLSSAQDAGSEAPAAVIQGFIPDSYNISAAQIRTIDAVARNSSGVSVPGTNTTLNFTVSGVKPGNIPIGTSLTWFHDTAQVGGSWQSGYDDVAPELFVGVMELPKPTPESIRFYLRVKFGDLYPALWRVATWDQNAWLCEEGGAACTLRQPVIIESDPPF